MEAVDWTALGVLTAVVLAAVGYLARDMHVQLHRLEARLDARFEQVERQFEQVERRFEQVDGRFDRVERRLDDLTERYVRHLEAHAAH